MPTTVALNLKASFNEIIGLPNPIRVGACASLDGFETVASEVISETAFEERRWCLISGEQE